MNEALFVKYKNKKIHAVGDDTPYVQMDELFEIVAAGTKIKVVEDTTGDDVTVPVLARLIYERTRKNRKAFKPEDLMSTIKLGKPEKSEKGKKDL